MNNDRPLVGWRVLVPRGGSWGDEVAAGLRAKGAVPVVAPLINFAPTNDQDAREQALAQLATGVFDWVAITSATTVDVLYAHGAKIHPRTKIAAVGEITAAAVESAGYAVSLTSSLDNSASRLAEQLSGIGPAPLRVLSLRGELARPILSRLLERAGHDVTSVIAYRTVGVPVTTRVKEQVASGRINVILVTSGSVATQVREQFPAIPESTLVVAIGPHTAVDAAREGLPVRTSDERTVTALIQTVSEFALPHAADEFPT